MKNILTYFAETVQQYPDKVAFADQFDAISFHELKEKAQQISNGITFTGKRIAVLVENDIESIILIFAVLYSGNCYIPVDREMPASRMLKMLSTAEVCTVLAAKAISWGELLSIPFFTLAQLEQKSTTEKYRETVACTDNAPCYMVFTSGSTGVPKAVLKSHRSLSMAIEAYCKGTGISADDILGNQSPLDYDAAAKDIYAAVYTGATCVFIPKICFSFPKKLLEFMQERRITSIAWSAAAFSLLAEMKGLEKIHINSLKRIMFSGAVLPSKHLIYWQSHYPGAEYINLYGPTEVTCTSTLYRPGLISDTGYEMPLGRPLDHTKIVLTDAEYRLIKDKGIVGEIVIISDYAADGYYNDVEQSDLVFRPNVYSNGAPVAYFTGDLGHFEEDDMLYFNGRKDHMVKHHGHRVELGEIEAAAASLDYVALACCLYDKRKEKIVLIYQASENRDKQLYISLKDLLPKYMLPSKCVFVEGMIMTATGKIDRITLKEKFLDAEN